ncbi:MAG: substrate-binding domain-containing protein [Planctomycetaceae bacterium]|jgi:ABC-type molybdate transport system substrate-binding protein|nr:substrate-binding domain-containing protein [Planctomycetaceae bacterium]
MRFFCFFIFGFCCVLFAAGCGEKVTLKVYCDELFWAVIWEESVQFQRVYGKQVELLRNYPTEQIHDDTDVEHESVKKSYVPAPWRSMPKNERDNENNENDNNNKPKNTLDLNDNVTQTIFNIREALPGDMYLTESGLQTMTLKEQSLVSREYPFCYLTMVLLVPKGNPLFIDSVRNTLNQRHRLGIVDPSITGMGSVALDIITKVSNKTKTANKKNENDNKEYEQVKIYDTIEELLIALEQNQIDAALTWDACAQRAEKYAEIVRLEKKGDKKNDTNKNNPNAEKDNKSPIETVADDAIEEHRLIRVSIVSLTIAANESHCRRFADFLMSTEGQRILRRHGFVPTGK